MAKRKRTKRGLSGAQSLHATPVPGLNFLYWERVFARMSDITDYFLAYARSATRKARGKRAALLPVTASARSRACITCLPKKRPMDPTSLISMTSGRPNASSVKWEMANMFLFFSNRTGIAGSLVISLLLSAVLLYACSA